MDRQRERAPDRVLGPSAADAARGRALHGPPGRRSPLAVALVALTAAVLAACGPDAPGEDGKPAARAGSAGPVRGVRAIDPPAGPGSGQPRLTVGPAGRVLLSWLQPVSGGHGHELVFSELADGSWGSPRLVARGEDFFVNWADLPAVVATGGDSLAAHWLEKTGPGPYAYGIRIAFSADGGRSWSAPVIPHRDGTQTEHGFVSLLPSASGGVRAVWLDGRRLADGAASAPDPAMTLRSATVRPGGAIRSSALLDARVCDCCQTSAAATARGALVVYRDRSEDEVRDIASVRRKKGGWSRPRPVHRDGWRIDACPVNGPALAARGRTAVVAWFTAAEGRARVRVAFSRDAGESFGAPLDVSRADPVGRVDVALLERRGALVSWVERTEGAAEIRLRRMSPTGPAGPAATLAAASAARAGGFPRMVVRGGEAIVAWTDPAGRGRVRAVRARLAAP